MKKGFTLIELLAVIVILAIIALIAVPIVLNIINDSKINANKRSIDMYAKAVENAVASYKLNGNSLSGEFITTDGKTVVSKTDSNIKFNVDYSGSKVVCETFKIYENGKFYLSDCKVADALVTNYSKGEEQKKPSCIIERQNEDTYTIGDIVTCVFSESTDKFYIIENDESDATQIKMLTEKNIHITEFRQNNNAGTIAFSSEAYWSNQNPYPTQIYDERNDIIKPIINEYINYINKGLLDAVTGSLLTGDQAENVGCDLNKFTCGTDTGHGELETWAPQWVYSTNYWIDLSMYDSLMLDCVRNIDDGGGLTVVEFSFDEMFGVRPVITISTKNIK